MVNTRRTESIGSPPEITPLHRTRNRENGTDSSSVSESEEESQSEEASWGSQDKSKPIITKKESSLGPLVRQLRSRFIHPRKYSSRVREINTRKRRSIMDYSSRVHANMYNGNDSDEEDYTRHSRRRPLRSHLDRIERRTALSLRPISQKCYADSMSDTEPRRSTRQRKSTMSWLADDQMHKVGYPNLNTPGYSEEDSRDVPEETRRSTRHSSDLNSNKRREIKNPKYLYDYETNEVLPRTRRSKLSLLSPTVRHESNDKENSEDTALNGRPRRRLRRDEADDEEEPGEGKKTDETTGDDSNEAKPVQENGVANLGGQPAAKAPNQIKEESSDSGPLVKTNKIITYSRTRARTRRAKYEVSSESEEAREGYSLRNRAPKPNPISKKSVLRAREHPRSRKRFTRRREVSNSSTSSSDSDMRVKTPKTQHSKNEQKMKSGAGGSKIIPIGPETLDTKVRFSSIGGLDGHIQCLKEMILLPMMYPEVFRQFQIQPPRGVLFHGPPGTGKTLIARALANECSFGCRKVSFFMRKGADLLSKWIGESEKQLRLLFEQASEMSPSIIFFDELDGLAPVRSSRQDQVHASIVSTLLALMDGLDNRGEVIVIGATNRIDAIDPALRRPGRFDRELFFPLPAAKEREAILKVHVSQWTTPPNDQLVSYLAQTAVGYCGSDLRALCSEAVIQSFRRTYPQVYNADYRLMLDPKNVKVEKIDFLRAKSLLVPASHRITQSLGRKLMTILEPLLEESLTDVFKILAQTFPHALDPALSKVKLSPNIRPAQLLILGESPDCGQTMHLAPAILYRMEHIHAYILDLTTLFRETGRSAEEACIQVFNEARRNVPSVIYIPNIENWWSLVNQTVKSILEAQLAQMDPNIPILLLATAETTYDNLPDEVQNIFSRYRKEVFELNTPTEENREKFFRPLLIESCLKPPRNQRQRANTPPPLPRACTPLPAPLSEEQSKKLYEQEEHTLRELRIFLRDICKKLANNKLFFMFTKPVDTAEVPDYTNIIKQPMDLETMMTKVDFHRYECAKDFLTDIELICQNALEYNPAKTSADKQIRHRACSLRDYAYTLIKNEMDSDFEDKCQDIAVKRQTRKASVQKYLPAYIQTPDNANLEMAAQEGNIDNSPPVLEAQTTLEAVKPTIKSDEKVEKCDTPRLNISSGRKRKLSNWQRGMVKKQKRKHRTSEEPLSQEGSGGTEDKRESSDEALSNGDVISETPTDINLPLSISVPSDNCQTKSVLSPRRRLSDLMSPSELLENPLEFDDIDQALNEEDKGDDGGQPVQCQWQGLFDALQRTKQVTAGCTVQTLLDLYNQLNRIIKKFSNTNAREELPKDLDAELTRFQKDFADTVSEMSQEEV